MHSKALEFCTPFARAARMGAKTTTWKPLSPADQARRAGGYTSDSVPYPIGAVTSILEPWGYLDGAIVYAATFSGDPPPNFKLQRGVRSAKKATIVSCDLVRLATMNEAEAVLAGAIPPNGVTALDEYKRQWGITYSGPLAWDANPLCWRVGFTVNDEA